MQFHLDSTVEKEWSPLGANWYRNRVTNLSVDEVCPSIWIWEESSTGYCPTFPDRSSSKLILLRVNFSPNPNNSYIKFANESKRIETKRKRFFSPIVQSSSTANVETNLTRSNLLLMRDEVVRVPFDVELFCYLTSLKHSTNLHALTQICLVFF